MKTLVFDSSSIISLSEKCFLNIVGKLAEKKHVEFLIPQSVLRETVQVPLKIRRFELNAIRIKTAIRNNWIKVVKPENISRGLLEKIRETTDNICYAQNKPIQIIHEGELQALALTKTVSAQALVIDERTTRMLLEEPQNLLKVLEFRNKKKVTFDERKLLALQRIAGGTKMLRSSEILAIAFEENCFEHELEQNKASLKAALLSLKYAGCAVTENEIAEYLKGIR